MLAATTPDAVAQDSLNNPAAFEKLVVRLIPRPSSRTVAVGDVVAFHSPLDPNNSHRWVSRTTRELCPAPTHTWQQDFPCCQQYYAPCNTWRCSSAQLRPAASTGLSWLMRQAVVAQLDAVGRHSSTSPAQLNPAQLNPAPLKQ
jgi:hypothetical protein